MPQSLIKASPVGCLKPVHIISQLFISSPIMRPQVSRPVRVVRTLGLPRDFQVHLPGGRPVAVADAQSVFVVRNRRWPRFRAVVRRVIGTLASFVAWLLRRFLFHVRRLAGIVKPPVQSSCWRLFAHVCGALFGVFVVVALCFSWELFRLVWWHACRRVAGWWAFLVFVHGRALYNSTPYLIVLEDVWEAVRPVLVGAGSWLAGLSWYSAVGLSGFFRGPLLESVGLRPFPSGH